MEEELQQVKRKKQFFTIRAKDESSGGGGGIGGRQIARVKLGRGWRIDGARSARR